MKRIGGNYEEDVSIGEGKTHKQKGIKLCRGVLERDLSLEKEG